MKVKHFESICMYLPIMVVCILLGTLVRISFISKGADSFTANIFFIVVIFVGVVIYAGLNLFLHTVYDIVKRIITNRRQPALVNEVITLKPFIADFKEQVKANEMIKLNDRLENALKYTREQFTLYTSEEDLYSLCEYITIYSKKERIGGDIKPVKVHTLSNTDLYHFGWNIWRHFDKRKQDEIAIFLKTVFANSFKDVETNSIKSHLKDDESRGIIKLCSDIAD
ncbi:hypothetical protein MTQ00_10820 [Chryseobacterium sp. B21-037]|uniref:hypothetical protein n=1 Tax=Chryseobacterium sp. B21-037 TaxID=2926038 RepID=UPI002359200B|nr:hypothetical protein [Chryseobacterium sp. B21-037]MDC8105033.1 hypothetical protein [Chryseobacterium sp. B21-037]